MLFLAIRTSAYLYENSFIHSLGQHINEHNYPSCTEYDCDNKQETMKC